MADQEFADLQSLFEQWGFSDAAKYFEEESLSSFMNLSISQFIDSIPYTYERLNEFKDVHIQYCIEKRKLDQTAIDVNILSGVNSNTALSPSVHPGTTFQTGNSALSICSLEFTSNKENTTEAVDLDSDIVMTSLQNDPSDNDRDMELASRQSYSSLELNDPNDPIKELQAQLGSVQVQNTTKNINNDSGKSATKRPANRKPIGKGDLVKDKIGSLKTLESFFTARDYDDIATDILKSVPLDEIHRHQYHSKGSSVKDKDGVRSKNASRGTLPTAVNAIETGPLLRADFWTRVVPPCENMPDIPKGTFKSLMTNELFVLELSSRFFVDTLNDDQNGTFQDEVKLTWTEVQDLYEAWKRNRVARFTRIYEKFTISEIVVRFEIMKNQE
ncbi:hypothetical protein QAD02_002643 [Eretmocerus hayati]|uniref:Uncharacterized protein n=1 Tax=Eretmocerus hayati TaxID=131215 RepID=A0ACC2NJS3_9HYME|nr:hypothetical protein QAD02_002643 [Eretmocerus hayati]